MDNNLISCAEVAEILNVSPTTVARFVGSLNLYRQYVVNPKNRHKMLMINESDIEKIESEIEAKNNKKKPKKKKAVNQPKTIEQLRAEHPLVKDDRFFKESYFPNTELEK